MSFVVVIPARYQSTRLPGKPLADIHGKPMIQWVAERALQAGAERVIVATDDERVAAAVKIEGVEICMTSPDHQSGTERLAEVCERYAFAPETIIVNVQGDEPLIDPNLIADTAQQLADSGADIATLAHPIENPAEFFSPNVVKVVCKANHDALYFSRAPIPYARDHFAQKEGHQSLPENLPALRHIGLYAYRASFLKTYSSLSPAQPEQFEALEQLRALYHGFRITVLITKHLPMPGVDTEEDAKNMQAHFRQLQNS